MKFVFLIFIASAYLCQPLVYIRVCGPSAPLFSMESDTTKPWSEIKQELDKQCLEQAPGVNISNGNTYLHGVNRVNQTYVTEVLSALPNAAVLDLTLVAHSIHRLSTFEHELWINEIRILIRMNDAFEEVAFSELNQRNCTFISVMKDGRQVLRINNRIFVDCVTAADLLDIICKISDMSHQTDRIDLPRGFAISEEFPQSRMSFAARTSRRTYIPDREIAESKDVYLLRLLALWISEKISEKQEERKRSRPRPCLNLG